MVPSESADLWTLALQVPTSCPTAKDCQTAILPEPAVCRHFVFIRLPHHHLHLCNHCSQHNTIQQDRCDLVSRRHHQTRCTCQIENCCLIVGRLLLKGGTHPQDQCATEAFPARLSRRLVC